MLSTGYKQFGRDIASLAFGTLRVGAPPKTIADDGGRHVVILTIWNADAETKVYWRSPDGNAPRTTVISGRGVQTFQTLGEFKLEAVGEPNHEVQYGVTVRQRDLVCLNEALITVTNELLAQINAATVPARGLPGYTFERAPGESWRSKFDTRRNLVVVNNGHRDFVYASRAKSLKLRYLVRLYAKELVLYNFAGLPTEHLLERMVELSLRTEEHL